MNIDFTRLDELLKNAAPDFWDSKGKKGYKRMFQDVVTAVGLPESSMISDPHQTTLPGGYGFETLWDLLIRHESKLLAVLRIRSLATPFSDEENPDSCIIRAIGAATNFHRSIQDGLINMHPRPYLGFLILVDDKGSPLPVRAASPDFNSSFYREDFENSCRRLVQDGTYDSTSLLFSSHDRWLKGEVSEFDSGFGLKRFLAEFLIHLQWRLNIMALG